MRLLLGSRMARLTVRFGSESIHSKAAQGLTGFLPLNVNCSIGRRVKRTIAVNYAVTLEGRGAP